MKRRWGEWERGIPRKVKDETPGQKREIAPRV